MPAYIDRWKYSRFITLATNDSGWGSDSVGALPYRRLRDTLRKFDARMNHKILGKKWAIRDYDRIWAWWFLEKPNSNPHWHGLVRFYDAENVAIAEQEKIFDEEADRIWKRLIPSGTVNIQPIMVQRGVCDYVCKMIGYPLSYEHFIAPDEFKRG